MNRYDCFRPSEEMDKKMGEILQQMPYYQPVVAFIARYVNTNFCRIADALSIEFERGGDMPVYQKVCSTLDSETVLRLLEYVAMAYPKAVAKKLMERL